jgi:hypothetical protein
VKRIPRLVDLAPKWVSVEGRIAGVRFNCPEGHADCLFVIPFTPALDGKPYAGWQKNGAVWQRTNTDFATLSLSPSIRNHPTYTSRDDAIAKGALPEYLTEGMYCAMHVFLTNGVFTFCSDSR